VEKATTDMQAKLDAATDPAALQAAIGKRSKLVEDAKLIAPELEIDEKLDDQAVQTAALVAAGFTADTFDGRDAGFVEGVFAGALATAKREDGKGKGKGKPPPARTRSTGAKPPTVRTDDKDGTEEKVDSGASYARMVEDNRKMHEKPFGKQAPTA
jgi:hypothetical protein